MQAGRLDRTVTLERFTTNTDTFGGEARTWATLATRRALYTPVSDGERSQAAETAATIECRFLIRWSSDLADLSPKDRLTFDGRTFNIVGVKEVGRREGLEISASARAE
jgi:SPP1 family predicted phage head-tail adaptor